MILLQCPNCKQKMKYQPRDNKLNRKKKKRCVYCGRTFQVVEQITK